MVREAVALFDDAGLLEGAVSDLQGRGFDRADISFLAQAALEDQPNSSEGLADNPATPRETPVTATDIRQERVLATSMVATIAAFAAAGFTVATGGAAALAAAAAIAAGGGVGAVGAWFGSRLGDEEAAYYDAQLARGGVLLWVRLRRPEDEARALEVLRRYSPRVAIRDVAAGAAEDLPSDPG
jgi:hypothetical protein